MMKIKVWIACVLGLLLIGCGGSSKPKYQKSPIDKLIVQYVDVPNYSVILADMDYKEAEDKYYHKYRVLLPQKAATLTEAQKQDSISGKSDVKVVDMPMQEVTALEFEEHIEDLGMTILSKVDGKLSRESEPAGYSHYVGNRQYGSWHSDSSGSFWVFYGRYRFLSDMFYGPSWRYGRNDYNDYRDNYRNRRSYYGKENKYGTGHKANRGNSWQGRDKSFKSQVRNKVSRSAGEMRSRGYNSSRSYAKNKTNSSNTKTSRSGSRYSSTSSSRSRSSGFGK